MFDKRKKLDQINNAAHKFSGQMSGKSSLNRTNISKNVRDSKEMEGHSSSKNNVDTGNKQPLSPGTNLMKVSDQKISGNTDVPVVPQKKEDTTSGLNEVDRKGANYVSPLDHMRVDANPGLVFDPDKILCRFELGGKCSDSSCPFQHCNK